MLIYSILQSTSIVRAPGYTLTRTPSSVKMDINTSAFFVGGEEEEEVSINYQLIAIVFEYNVM